MARRGRDLITQTTPVTEPSLEGTLAAMRWHTVYDGPCPVCGKRIQVAQHQGGSDEMVGDCGECGARLDILVRGRFASATIAGPTCEICDLNGMPTDGPLCVHCDRCEEDCDGGEYPEEWPESHSLRRR
jgi:hypothetical protein